MRSITGGKLDWDIFMKTVSDQYAKIISIENLLSAWEEFVVNKKKRTDMRIFAQNLFPNILALHNDLINLTYRHASYNKFNITDPKPRIIHKAIVRDRLLHHAIYRILYPILDKTFIFDSYSCRKKKGTHRGFKGLVELARKQSKNYSGPCWALKCDIRKFFASIDHEILKSILSRHIVDKNIKWLLGQIIDSFHTNNKIGLPLGNVEPAIYQCLYERIRSIFKKRSQSSFLYSLC